ISSQLVGLTVDRDLPAEAMLLAFLIGTAIIAGVALGYPQSLVLQQRVYHPQWWVLANIPGPVAGAVLIFLTLLIENENGTRDYNTLTIAALSGAITGIALTGLLRRPTQHA